MFELLTCMIIIQVSISVNSLTGIFKFYMLPNDFIPFPRFISSHLLSGLFSFKEKWGVPTGPDVTTGRNYMYIIHQTLVQNKVINRAIFFFFLFFFFCGVVLFCFETGFSHYVVPGWSQIQRAACLGHLNAGFKCMSYYAGFREKEIERKILLIPPYKGDWRKTVSYS